MEIKRTPTFVDEFAAEAGQRLDPPLCKAAAAAIVDYPFAGRHQLRARTRSR